MLISPGKSARSRSRTCPMLNSSPPSADSSTVRSAARFSAATPTASALGVAGVEHQPVLADLDLVTVVQRDLVDPVAVDVGAVETAHVRDGVARLGALELRVPARDGHVVEEDVAVRV